MVTYVQNSWESTTPLTCVKAGHTVPYPGISLMAPLKHAVVLGVMIIAVISLITSTSTRRAGFFALRVVKNNGQVSSRSSCWLSFWHLNENWLVTRKVLNNIIQLSSWIVIFYTTLTYLHKQMQPYDYKCKRTHRQLHAMAISSKNNLW
jgi:hypothetical protein